jgi:hypothetical protein
VWWGGVWYKNGEVCVWGGEGGLERSTAHAQNAHHAVRQQDKWKVVGYHRRWDMESSPPTHTHTIDPPPPNPYPQATSYSSFCGVGARDLSHQLRFLLFCVSRNFDVG